MGSRNGDRRAKWTERALIRLLSLAKEKRLQAPGLLQVSAAKADGRWARAYASPSAAQVPAHFLEALAKDPQALAFFKTLNKSNIYAICYRLSTAKRPQTRARRFEQLLALVSAGKKLH